MAATIHVGTSGYSFKDWIGTVYPKGIASGDMLPYYARFFDTVEVNSTYYRVPSPFMFENMLKKVPAEFTFVVKLPKEMTHEREKFDTVVGPLRTGIAPLLSAGQLGGLLAQFPYSFKAGSEGLDHLQRLADAVSDWGVPVNVEFRHTGWYDEAVYARLVELSLGFVNVDLPPLSGLPRASNVTTSDVAYYRLHGRNAKLWWHHPTPSHRYDYLYSGDELERWAQRIEETVAKAKTAYIFHNNCHLGQSVVNALQLHQRFNLEAPTHPPGLAPGLFAPQIDEQIAALKARIEQARAAER
jgi:uncharacterized protein YecE (DUF72 family)